MRIQLLLPGIVLSRAGEAASGSASILAPRQRGPDPAARILLRLSLPRRPVCPAGLTFPPPGCVGTRSSPRRIVLMPLGCVEGRFSPRIVVIDAAGVHRRQIFTRRCNLCNTKARQIWKEILSCDITLFQFPDPVGEGDYLHQDSPAADRKKDSGNQRSQTIRDTHIGS